MSRANTPNGVLPEPGGQRIPYHVGIVMDGNGRWAQQRGQPRVFGHRAGTDNIRRVLEASGNFGIKVLTIYAFSTENWNRPPAEVRAAYVARHAELLGLIDAGC